MSELQPPSPYAFVLRLDAELGADGVGFQEASGIGPELETEVVREGGENRFVHAMPGHVKPASLVLKRGIARPGSALVRWCRDALEGPLDQPVIPRRLGLRLVGEDGEALRTWLFHDAYPVQWTVEPFATDKDALAIEALTIAYARSARGA